MMADARASDPIPPGLSFPFEPMQALAREVIALREEIDALRERLEYVEGDPT
jgi:hypothetical protein